MIPALIALAIWFSGIMTGTIPSFAERRGLHRVVGSNFHAFQVVEGRDRPAGMDALRLRAVKAPIDVEILVSSQRIRGDEPGIDQRRLAHVPVQAGQLDDGVVGKPVRASFRA